MMMIKHACLYAWIMNFKNGVLTLLKFQNDVEDAKVDIKEIR